MKKNTINFTKTIAMAFALLLITSKGNAAIYKAIASGKWSSSTTWDTTAPSYTNTGDVITIPSGITVTLDNNLTINGASAVVSVMGKLTSASGIKVTITLGSLTGSGVMDIGDLSIGSGAALVFAGTLDAETFTSASTSLKATATMNVKKTLTIAAGTFSVQTGGAIKMASQTDIIMSGGVLTISGGSLDLTNEYNVTYSAASDVEAGIELNGSGLKNVTIDLPSSSNTVSLSADLTVKGVLTLTSGTLKLGARNLIIEGDVATNGKGSISSTAASDISIKPPKGITGSLEFAGNDNAVNNLTIDAGAAYKTKIKGVLTVEGSLGITSGEMVMENATLKIKGTISETGTGVITSDETSAIEVNSTNSPFGTIRFSSASVVKSLKVNIANGGVVKIGSDIKVKENLTLTKGNIDIGDNHLDIDATGSISGGSGNSYIITSSKGYLKMKVNAGAGTAINFPVGTSAKYYPAAVSLKSGSSTGNVGVGVAQHVYENGTTGAEISGTQHTVDATWFVNSDISSNLNMTLSVMWAASAEINGFDRTKANIAHYTNNKWDLDVTSAATIDGNGMYTVSRTNISSLSPFAVFDNTTSGISSINLLQLEVYPNPTSDIIYVNNLKETNAVFVDVMTLTGQLIARYKIDKSCNTISLKGWNAGTYLVKLFNHNNEVVKQIIMK